MKLPIDRAAAVLAIVLASTSCLELRAASQVASRSDSIGPQAAWIRDAAWYDGRAEKCTYEATRTIYGKERRYEAIAYTNKERVDPRTTCKTDDAKGLEVFKHHWSEIVPTENYAYRFSTMTYTTVSEMAAYKLTVSTQEDCGASFKECWESEGRLHWSDSVYFPGAGRRSGEMDEAFSTRFADALPLTLRWMAFDSWTDDRVLSLLPSQKDTHAVSWTRIHRRMRRGPDALQQLPIGAIEAREVDLLDDSGAVVERFWFATDATPPTLNALVRYEGPNGVTYRLKSIERTKYWER